jgi:hypothetical protein
MPRTEKSATTKLFSKEDDKDARKFIVRNVANDLFSLALGPRSHYYGVIGLEQRKAKKIYPWIMDGMLDHLIMKLKKSKMKGVTICESQVIHVLQANTTDDHEEQEEKAETIGVLTGGRPTGSTIEAS